MLRELLEDDPRPLAWQANSHMADTWVTVWSQGRLCGASPPYQSSSIAVSFHFVGGCCGQSGIQQAVLEAACQLANLRLAVCTPAHELPPSAPC